MSGMSHTGNSGLGRSSESAPRRVPKPAARIIPRTPLIGPLGHATGPAPDTRSCRLLVSAEGSIDDGATGSLVKGLGTDVGDHPAVGQAAHVVQTGDEQRLAQPAAPV